MLKSNAGRVHVAETRMQRIHDASAEEESWVENVKTRWGRVFTPEERRSKEYIRIGLTSLQTKQKQ